MEPTATALDEASEMAERYFSHFHQLFLHAIQVYAGNIN